MQKQLVQTLIIGAGLIAGACVLYRALWSSEPSPAPAAPAALVETLHDPGASPAQKTEAVMWLQHTGPTSAPPLRDALADTSPQVRSTAAAALGQMHDQDAVTPLLVLMDDPDPVVRGRAGAAVVEILHSDFKYRADAPPAERKHIIEVIRNYWEHWKATAPEAEARWKAKHPGQN